MPSDPNELMRVLAELDFLASCVPLGEAKKDAADAARLLREMAADFDTYADHWIGADGDLCPHSLDRDCTCGLDAARKRWRLEP